ncbi:hypothetical protein SAMN05421493_12412 [Pseudobutyrivibrio sp. 49]|uniref:metallophosphoesterase n=1 Tax=Pseudobutyrivibrio sp. 49 TaxID=1855344 RepID=UPI000883845E|nr:metallophosphoesterase [Pseudobutyrivibrio sp. 49]SDI71918.1 hypothetical protein SAMN05421493_12412 [Pseudobutyrivibrio sp. 49]
MKKKKKRIGLKIFLTILILLCMGFISPLKLTKYDLHFSTLPEEFDGYKIVQISDFHCKEFGNNESLLIKTVKNTKPDLIVLTGDIVDEEHTVDNARYLLEGLRDVAPMYYVTGNHEYYTDGPYGGAPYDKFREICIENDVTILHNETAEIEKDGAKIRISGLDWWDSSANMRDVLGYADLSYFNILLCHDAAKFNFLSEYGYDLLFTGHIHGGLVRVPIGGGVFASDYTFFPKYDHGLYREKNSTMVCSSGLGDARIPRWNNPREVVFVKLHKD